VKGREGNSINEDNIYAKQGDEVWEIKIKLPGRRNVKESDGEKQIKCDGRKKRKSFDREVRIGRDEINFTACSVLRVPSSRWPVLSVDP
jgi:hypothetical protein